MRHIILTNKLKGPLGRLPRALSYHPLNILTRRHSRDDTVSTSFLYKRSCVTGVPGKHCAGMPVTTCLDESIWMQSKAHSDGSVYPVHHGAVYPAHVFPQAFFVQGPNLFQQDHGVLRQTELPGRQFNVRGQLCLPGLGGDGCRDDSRAVAVAGVILHDEYRTNAPLFTAHHWAQVSIKDISTLYAIIHKRSHSAGSRILRYMDILSYVTRLL